MTSKGLYALYHPHFASLKRSTNGLNKFLQNPHTNCNPDPPICMLRQQGGWGPTT